jgi:uncharacterized protein
MQMKSALAGFLIMVALLTEIAIAQSFDCRRSSTRDEIAICKDRRLSQLDEIVDAAFRQAYAIRGARAVELARRLLSARRSCGSNGVCILDVQRATIWALAEMGAVIKSPNWIDEYRNELARSTPNQRNELPQSTGECVETTITRITTRFGNRLVSRPSRDQINEGTSISYSNGGFQISYGYEKEVARSKIGDLVRMCLVSIPKDCPPGDDRGREYWVNNFRTGEAWIMPDAQHMCGGA